MEQFWEKFLLYMENFFKHDIFGEEFLRQSAVLFLMEIGVAERFDGRGEVNCLDVIFHTEIEGSDIVPEACFREDSVHTLPAVVVHAAHKVCCDADLNAVKLRCFQYLIQGM